MSVFGANHYVTNFITAAVLTTSLSLSGKVAHDVSLNAVALSKGELYRLLTSQFYFKTWPQLLLGVIAIRSLAVFERYMGNRKFGSFVFLSWTLCAALQIGASLLSLAAGTGRLVAEPGPFFFVFSLLPLYYRYIPKTSSTQIHVLGFLSVSEKSWVYLLAAQMALSDGAGSLLAASAGLATGMLYLRDGSPLQRFRLPAAVERVCGIVGSFFGSILGGGAEGAARPGAAARNGGGEDGVELPHMGRHPPRQPVANGGGGTGGYGGLVQPSEENIASLMALGFDRQACEAALRSTNDHVDAAANLLLGGGGAGR